MYTDWAMIHAEGPPVASDASGGGRAVEASAREAKAGGVAEVGRIYTSQLEAFGLSALSGFGTSYRQRRGGGDVQAPGGRAVQGIGDAKLEAV